VGGISLELRGWCGGPLPRCSRCIGGPTVNQPQRAVTKVPGGVAAAAAEWKIAFCLFMPVAPDSRVRRERLSAEEGDKSLPPPAGRVRALSGGRSLARPSRRADRARIREPAIPRSWMRPSTISRVLVEFPGIASPFLPPIENVVHLARRVTGRPNPLLSSAAPK